MLLRISLAVAQVGRWASVVAAAAAMPQRIGLRFMLAQRALANNKKPTRRTFCRDHTRFTWLRELFETKPGAT